MADVLVRICAAIGALVVAGAFGLLVYTHDRLAPAQHLGVAAHVSRAQAEGALADLSDVTDLRPGSAGFVAEATLDLRVRRLAAAERAAQAAIRREPDNFSAWVLLAAARNAAGDAAGTRQALARAHRLNPLYVVAG